MIKDLIKLCKSENIKIEVKETISNGYIINIFNGEIKKDESFNTKDYKIKATSKGKTIILKTRSIEDQKEIVKLIKKNIKSLDSKDLNMFAKKQKLPKIKILKEKVNKKDILEQLLSFETLKKEYKNLTNLELEYSYIHNKISITNESTVLKDEYITHNFLSEIIVTEKSKNQTSWFNKTSKTFEFDNYRKKIIEKIKEAENKIKAVSYKSGKYNIVLKNECVFSLLIKFSELFYAENINKNLSCLTKKFNSKIFSDKITIIEDPSNDRYVGKSLFDDEGTKTFYKEIVKNGIFKTKLYDNKNALKDNVPSTGNSFGVRNLYIDKGDISFNKLINECNNGLLIDDITGLHSGLNKITGEFSLQAQGYVIEKGKLTKALKLIILSSNVFEIFSNIKEVGNDLEFNDVRGGAPSLLINNISISGSK